MNYRRIQKDCESRLQMYGQIRLPHTSLYQEHSNPQHRRLLLGRRILLVLGSGGIVIVSVELMLECHFLHDFVTST